MQMSNIVLLLQYVVEFVAWYWGAKKGGDKRYPLCYCQIRSHSPCGV